MFRLVNLLLIEFTFGITVVAFLANFDYNLVVQTREFGVCTDADPLEHVKGLKKLYIIYIQRVCAHARARVCMCLDSIGCTFCYTFLKFDILIPVY